MAANATKSIKRACII